MKNNLISAAIALAFEAGRWAGQVDLEEHFDREQYTNSMQEVFVSRKTAMPQKSASRGRTVTVNLRSEDWRVGVKKQVSELLEKAHQLANNAQQSVHRIGGESAPLPALSTHEVDSIGGADTTPPANQ